MMVSLMKFIIQNKQQITLEMVPTLGDGSIPSPASMNILQILTRCNMCMLDGIKNYDQKAHMAEMVKRMQLELPGCDDTTYMCHCEECYHEWYIDWTECDYRNVTCPECGNKMGYIADEIEQIMDDCESWKAYDAMTDEERKEIELQSAQSECEQRMFEYIG